MRLDNGVGRISQLPDETLVFILSFLSLKEAASTSVLSSPWLNLWKEIPNLKFNLKSDRISQLPDHILIVILSFLSMKRAAVAGVLSSRWSDVWKHSPYLDFDYYNVDAVFNHQIVNVNWHEAVNSVIQSHKALSLKQFRICFRVDRSAKSTVTKWLEFVVSRRVESLELNFSFAFEPDMVVLEESLREMSIVFGAPQTLFFCQSLKSLCLDCLKVGGQDVELFLHNCPLLEKLTILMAVLTSDINVCGAKLKLKCIRVSAPNLSSLMFCAEVGKLVLEYAPGLVEADLTSLSSEFVVQHIALFSKLQILRFTNYSYEDLTDMFPRMPDLKKLSISFESFINRSFLRLTDLIWASPHLEEFELRLLLPWMMGRVFDSDFPPKVKKCALRFESGIDRISEMPDGILFLILSFLRARKAASTTVLSSRWLDLWKENPNLKFNLSDRLSQLPDQVIIAILSLLTVKQMVATSVLSSRWSDLWKHTPCLNFDPVKWDMDDHGGFSDEEFIEIVNSVIQSHKAPSLKLFGIYFPIENSAKSAVTKWLEFVFSTSVESLELDFSLLHESNMVVLEDSLREASIICRAPQTLPFCQSLKGLLLRSLKLGAEDVELFLRNCPLLEELTIICASLTSDINVSGAKLLLKHFDIRLFKGAKSIRVSAPHLSSFRFSDNTNVGNLVLEYVPELVEAELKFVSSEFVVQHVALISQLQILKLSFSHSKKLSLGMFSHMPNLKKLSICFVCLKNHSPLRLADLIWASPCLEEFTFKFSMAFNGASTLTEDVTNVERSPHQNLRVFKIKTHPEPTDHLVELATYISDNCIALREIVIGSLVQKQAHWDNLRQQLQGRVRSQIQLRLYSLV